MADEMDLNSIRALFETMTEIDYKHLKSIR